MTAWLSPAAVAEHLDVRVRRLPALVKAGKLPRPSYHLGPRSPRWDSAAIDSLMFGRQARDDMDRLTAEVINDIRSRRAKNAGRRNDQGIPLQSR